MSKLPSINIGKGNVTGKPISLAKLTFSQMEKLAIKHGFLKKGTLFCAVYNKKKSKQLKSFINKCILFTRVTKLLESDNLVIDMRSNKAKIVAAIIQKKNQKDTTLREQVLFFGTGTKKGLLQEFNNLSTPLKKRKERIEESESESEEFVEKSLTSESEGSEKVKRLEKEELFKDEKEYENIEAGKLLKKLDRLLLKFEKDPNKDVIWDEIDKLNTDYKEKYTTAPTKQSIARSKLLTKRTKRLKKILNSKVLKKEKHRKFKEEEEPLDFFESGKQQPFLDLEDKFNQITWEFNESIAIVKDKGYHLQKDIFNLYFREIKDIEKKAKKLGQNKKTTNNFIESTRKRVKDNFKTQFNFENRNFVEKSLNKKAGEYIDPYKKEKKVPYDYVEIDPKLIKDFFKRNELFQEGDIADPFLTLRKKKRNDLESFSFSDVDTIDKAMGPIAPNPFHRININLPPAYNINLTPPFNRENKRITPPNARFFNQGLVLNTPPRGGIPPHHPGGMPPPHPGGLPPPPPYGPLGGLGNIIPRGFFNVPPGGIIMPPPPPVNPAINPGINFTRPLIKMSENYGRLKNTVNDLAGEGSMIRSVRYGSYVPNDIVASKQLGGITLGPPPKNVRNGKFSDSRKLNYNNSKFTSTVFNKHYQSAARDFKQNGIRATVLPNSNKRGNYGTKHSLGVNPIYSMPESYTEPTNSFQKYEEDYWDVLKKGKRFGEINENNDGEVEKIRTEDYNMLIQAPSGQF